VLAKHVWRTYSDASDSPSSASSSSFTSSNGSSLVERAKFALAPMPPWMASEHAVLSGLARGATLQQAFQRAPHKLRLMYLHAYQSKLWNAAAASRAQLGLEVIVGDLVLIDNPSAAAGDDTYGEAMTDDAEAPQTKARDDQGETQGSSGGRAKGEVRGLRGRSVHRVTSSDVLAKTYCIDQVVLPLPGHGVDYPSYSPTPSPVGAPAATAAAPDDVAAKAEGGSEEAAEGEAPAKAPADVDQIESDGVGFYDVLLAADDLTQASLKRPDEYTLSGDYRPLLQRASGFTWQLARYKDATDVVLPSDADELTTAHVAKLQGATEEAVATSSDANNESFSTKDATTVAVAGEGPELAVALSFMLPSSSYATVFLRELLKQPMDAGYHTSLTQSFNAADSEGAVASVGVEEEAAAAATTDGDAVHED